MNMISLASFVQSIIAKKLSLHKKRLSLIENGKLTHASRLYEQAMQTFLKPEATQFNRNDRREKVISDDPTLRLLRDTEKDNIRKIWSVSVHVPIVIVFSFSLLLLLLLPRLRTLGIEYSKICVRKESRGVKGSNTS